MYQGGLFTKDNLQFLVHGLNLFPSGEKPFKCVYCEYATAQNSTLKIHLKRHHAASSTATTSGDF